MCQSFFWGKYKISNIGIYVIQTKRTDCCVFLLWQHWLPLQCKITFCKTWNNTSENSFSVYYAILKFHASIAKKNHASITNKIMLVLQTKYLITTDITIIKLL